MKKLLFNSVFACLLVLAIFCSWLILVLLNENFIIKEMSKNNYYDIVYDNIMRELESEYSYASCSIDKSVLESDINKYVKDHFSMKNIQNAIKCDRDIDLDKLYENHIMFKILKNKNTKVIYYLLCLITLVIIMIVGTIFIKTQKKHAISMIIFISSILLLGVYGILYLFVDLSNDMLNSIFVSANHYLLALAVLFLEISIIKKLNIKL